MNAAGMAGMAETGGCHTLLTAIPAEATEAPILNAIVCSLSQPGYTQLYILR